VEAGERHAGQITLSSDELSILCTNARGCAIARLPCYGPLAHEKRSSRGRAIASGASSPSARR